MWKGTIAVLGLFFLVLAWTLTIYPSNDAHWEPDVAQTAWAEIHGEHVTIHNFRNFDYRSSTDFIPNWETKIVDLTALRGIDLFVNYWGVRWMEHPVVSFQFGERAKALGARWDTVKKAWYVGPEADREKNR